MSGSGWFEFGWYFSLAGVGFDDVKAVSAPLKLNMKPDCSDSDCFYHKYSSITCSTPQHVQAGKRYRLCFLSLQGGMCDLLALSPGLGGAGLYISKYTTQSNDLIGCWWCVTPKPLIATQTITPVVPCTLRKKYSTFNEHGWSWWWHEEAKLWAQRTASGLCWFFVVARCCSFLAAILKNISQTRQLWVR